MDGYLVNVVLSFHFLCYSDDTKMNLQTISVFSQVSIVCVVLILSIYSYSSASYLAKMCRVV